ncbi:MAG: phosphotransferase enzyme family protein, partial [Ginsengibacter sp.]
MVLNDEILSAYNLEINDLDIEPIRNGLINTTWRIDNSHHSYILQKVNHLIFKTPQSIASNVKMVADYLLKCYPKY